MADGSRVSKDSLRVAAIGDIDELNSAVGIVVYKCPQGDIKEALITVQHDLFNLGSQLTMPECDLITEARIKWLEQLLDKMNLDLPPLKEFILPGGGEASAFCHSARTICRRTERTLVALAKEFEFNSHVGAYINRLSDFLFVVCRVLARASNEKEVYWKSERLSKINHQE